ncbi:MAG: thermonuclease family protein [Thermomicrobiales bacterium]
MPAKLARAVGTLLLAVVAISCDVERETSLQSTDSDDAFKEAQVVRTVDGDTIIVRVDGKEERLRYIGIDAPESVTPDQPVECFGRESSDANARIVDDGPVFLEADAEDRDRYGRLLRYVYVPAEDGSMTMVNRYLVEQGYAEAGSYPPNVRHQDELFAAESDAIEANRGLWGSCR